MRFRKVAKGLSSRKTFDQAFAFRSSVVHLGEMRHDLLQSNSNEFAAVTAHASFQRTKIEIRKFRTALLAVVQALKQPCALSTVVDVVLRLADRR